MVRKTLLTSTLAPVVRSLAGMINRTNPTAAGRRRGGARARKTSRRMARRTARRTTTRALPAAYAAHVTPRFNVASRSATTAIVSGCDLVHPIPATLTPGDETIFAMFPANPAYWMGTRISQFAPAYQNYRPLSFRVSYIPQVAVTQQGTVFMGTLWNEAAPENNIQQSLFTSNGGCLTQCYVPADTTVTLGRNLQQNLFTMNESLNPDTCPFMFLAGVRGADVVPGYFYVSYTYEFRNPIGSAWAFNTSQLTTVGDLPTLPRYANMTFVLAEQAGGFGPGTQLDLERDGSIFYHGSKILLDDSVHGVLYSNQQSTITTNTLASYFELTQVGLVNASGATTSLVPISNFNSTTGTQTLANGSTMVLIKEIEGGYTLLADRNGGAESRSVSVTEGKWYIIENVADYTGVGLVSAAGSVVSTTDTSDGYATSLTITRPYYIPAMSA